MRLARLFGLTALAALLTAGLAAADPPTPAKAKQEVATGLFCEVAVTTKAANQKIGYVILPEVGNTLFRELKTDSTTERVFWFQAPAPGTYYIGFWTKGETKASTTTIVVGKGGTPVVVEPKKDTTDPPVIEKKPIWGVIVVHDVGPTARNLAEYDFDPDLNALRKKYKFQMISKNNVGPDGKPLPAYAPYIEAAVNKKYPQYFVVGTDGKVITSGELPEKPADLVKILKERGTP